MSEPVKRWTPSNAVIGSMTNEYFNGPYVASRDYDLLLSQIEVLTRERDEARETLKTATLSWGVYISAETDDERDEAYEMMKDALTDKPGAA